MKKLFIYLFAALAVASCEHKDLCYDHSHTIDVEVVFVGGMLPRQLLNLCQLYLFPNKRRRGTAAMSSPLQGRYDRVPVGNYGALCLK